MAVAAPAVDAVALETRAAELCTRSIKQRSKLAALELAIRCMDLTTLEGADTPGRVAGLCARAARPDPDDPTVPPVAAVCVYPSLVAHARRCLGDATVAVASVAGAFPSGQAPLEERLAEIRQAVADGADEIDIVLHRGDFLAGRFDRVRQDIEAARDACGPAHLKTILEVAELGSYDAVRQASLLAMAAGSHFIKTSTGKLPVSATPAYALVMAEAIREHAASTGEMVGLKLAGGIRTAKQSWHYLVIVSETLGREWLTPARFRLGASSLLNDVLLQLRFQQSGRYHRPSDLPTD